MANRKKRPKFSNSSTTYDEVFLELLRRIENIGKIYEFTVFAQCADCELCRVQTKSFDCERLVFFQKEFSSESAIGKIVKASAKIPFNTQDGLKLWFKITIRADTYAVQQYLDGAIGGLSFQLSRITRVKFSKMRDAIVEKSVLSHDTGSFTYRCLEVLRDFLDFEGASIFIYESASQKLALSSTTGIKKMREGIHERRLKKPDISYFSDGRSWVSRCFRNGNEMYEHDSPPENTFGEDVETISNRVFLPIQIRPNTLAQSSTDNECVGVLRVVNTRKQNVSQSLAKVDQYLLVYFCEFVAVLSRLYERASNPVALLERATHGFIHDLAVLGGRLEQSVKMEIEPFTKRFERFVLESDLPSQKLAEHSSAIRDFQERIRLLLEDILSVRESMSAQLHSVLDTSDFATGRKIELGNVTTRQPYESLMRLIKTSPLISRSHGRPGPWISLSRDGDNRSKGIRYLPPLVINQDIFYLVLRNLIENSIKYKPDEDGAANINIDWRQTSGTITFLVSDDGIGIETDEEKYLFREGFRGRNTIFLSTRGNGIGLAFCKRVLQTYGAKLEYLGKNRGGRGAKFSIEIERA